MESDIEAEELIAIRSFDNILLRSSQWFSRFSSIQYHPGQTDILKAHLSRNQDVPTIFVVGVTVVEDLEYLRMALEIANVPGVEDLSVRESWVAYAELKMLSMIPVKMQCCPVEAGSNQDNCCLSAIGLRDLLHPIVERALDEPAYNLNIVPVVISKDHDSKKLWRFNFGSLCVSIFEPYSLQQYLANIKSRFQTGHLVTHLFFDMARNGPRLPSQLVAFILLNMDKDVNEENIVESFEWLRSVSMELNLQLAFTGSSTAAVDFALWVLQGYIELNGDEIYLTNYDALFEYAQTISANVAYYGIIARAIMSSHNSSDWNPMLTRFVRETRVRVLRKDVITFSKELAERIDDRLPCRRPCVTVETMVLDALDNMEKLGRFFHTEEPTIAKPKRGCSWMADDSDDEYWESKADDPRFQPWLVLSRKQQKLHILNMFINAVTPYLTDRII